MISERKKTTLRERIEEHTNDLRVEKESFLRECGWDYTSQYPGSYWMWSKKDKNGERVTANTDLAISMEDSGYGFE
jgi:hypothetical protein